MASNGNNAKELTKKCRELCLEFLRNDFDFDTNYKLKAWAEERPYGVRVLIQLHHLEDMIIQTLVRVTLTTELEILRKTFDCHLNLFQCQCFADSHGQATPTFSQMFSGVGSTLCDDDQ